jgi:putative zincin peptidase
MASRQLPPNYGPARVLNLSRPWTVVLLTLASGVLLLPFAWVAFRFAAAVRPGASLALAFAGESGQALILTLAIGVLVVPIVLHEAIHGACFWVYTRDRPRFALRGYAASTGAPDWHLPRGQYLVVGLAPMVVLTVVGLGLLAVAPEEYLGVIVLAITLHGAGTIGDVVSVLWLLRQPARTYFKDTGDVLSAYPPLATSDRP